MRGRLAAACAAVLVGLSPTGALPLVQFAAAACASADVSPRRVMVLSPAPRPLRRDRGTSVKIAPLDAVRSAPLFRTPGGPAPCQAPPALA